MMILFDDEADLQRQIVALLNKNGYNFKKTKANWFCDLIDDVNKCYVEVKQETFSPAQILYGLAKNNITDATIIGLGCGYEIRFYPCPPFDVILNFAKKIDPTLKKSPSSINKKDFNDEAFDIIGFHRCLWDYKGDFKIDDRDKDIYLNESNYEYFKQIFTKYNINPAQFLTFIAYVESSGSELKVNKQGVIYESKTLNKFVNQKNGYHGTVKKTLEGDTVHGEQDIKAVKDKRDRDLIESIRIKGAEIEKIIHKMDEITPLKIRRQIGKFFSGMDLGVYLAGVLTELVKPDFILEPMVGGGSLIAPFVGNVPCAINDINKGHVDLLEQKYGTQISGYFSEDFIMADESVLSKWNVPKDGNVLIYTNPPFGSKPKAQINRKKGEEVETIDIKYGPPKFDKWYGDTYGRGDLCIPAIAHMIEAIKCHGKGYLAFFSPFGVLLGRRTYNKVLKALLKDFEFLFAEVFSGNMFNGVSKSKAISISIWKYKPSCNTRHDSLVVLRDDAVLRLKKSVLLKDGWKYNEHKVQKGEIGVQNCDRFNSPTPKMFHLDLNKGGSELIQENVRIPLNVEGLPDELVYGLWSACVGHRSIFGVPVVFDNCYAHLPDFSLVETNQILAYVVMSTLITELKGNVCKGKIGFSGLQRVFCFGGKRLTDGANYLIDTHGNCPIGSRTIKEVFGELKEGNDPDKVGKNLRIDIRAEIGKRLDAIGYWDYLPIPDIGSEKEDDAPTIDDYLNRSPEAPEGE